MTRPNFARSERFIASGRCLWTGTPASAGTDAQVENAYAGRGVQGVSDIAIDVVVATAGGSPDEQGFEIARPSGGHLPLPPKETVGDGRGTERGSERGNFGRSRRQAFMLGIFALERSRIPAGAARIHHERSHRDDEGTREPDP